MSGHSVIAIFETRGEAEAALEVIENLKEVVDIGSISLISYDPFNEGVKAALKKIKELRDDSTRASEGYNALNRAIAAVDNLFKDDGASRI